MPDPLILWEDFSLVRDGRTLVHGDRWAVDRGQRVLLTGASGSGKSSFLLALAGLATDHAEGLTLRGATSSRPRTGLLLQNPYSQLVCPTVDDEVAFGLENAGWDWPSMVLRVAQLRQQFRLDSLGTRAPWTFSGGEAQRVALASVLAPRPDLVLLDEPLSYLDAPSARTLIDTVSPSDRSATWVVVDHDPRPWARWADVHYRLTEEGTWLQEPVAVAPEAPPLPQPLKTTEGILEVRGLTAGYGKGPAVLDGFDLDLARGETVAVTGPSGAGKSTLFRTLTGQLKVRSGTITVGGQPYLPRLKRPSPFAWVPQVPEHYFLYPTARQEWGTSGQAAHAFGLEALAGRHPFTLSEGEKRRLNLASALDLDRPIFLLDEPQYGLDTRSRLALEASLALLRARGKSLLIISHDPEFCHRVAHRVVEVAP